MERTFMPLFAALTATGLALTLAACGGSGSIEDATVGASTPRHNAADVTFAHDTRRRTLALGRLARPRVGQAAQRCQTQRPTRAV